MAQLANIRCVNKLDTENLELARWAVRRWKRFPAEALPRPLVLAQKVIESENGFLSAEAKAAWFSGAFEWAVDVPQGVRERARRSADQGKQEPAEAALLITEAGRGEREFLTDRGLETFPAYWLRGPMINGSLWVLDPEIHHWEPEPAPASSIPAAAVSRMSQLCAWSGRPVEVSADRRTVFFSWVGSLHGDYRVEVVETATAITAVAINQPKPTDRRGWWAEPGHTVRLSAHLKEPIGGRVFLDLHGDPAPLTIPPAGMT